MTDYKDRYVAPSHNFNIHYRHNVDGMRNHDSIFQDYYLHLHQRDQEELYFNRFGKRYVYSAQENNMNVKNLWCNPFFFYVLLLLGYGSFLGSLVHLVTSLFQESKEGFLTLLSLPLLLIDLTLHSWHQILQHFEDGSLTLLSRNFFNFILPQLLLVGETLIESADLLTLLFDKSCLRLFI